MREFWKQATTVYYDFTSRGKYWYGN